MARDELLRELRLLGAKAPILSTNVALRNDGLPLASQREPSDPGVAVYFDRKGRNLAFACDQWDRVQDNLQAVRLTIAALRGIARWGTGDMVDAAFRGFAALPPASDPWPVVLGVAGNAPAEHVEAAFRRLAAQNHPDRGGDTGQMAKINEAFEAFKRERATCQQPSN